MSMYVLIGKRIRQERQKRDLTLEQLAEMASISTGFLAYIERGQKPASLETLRKIAEAMGVPMASLFASIPSRSSSQSPAFSALLVLAPLLKGKKPEEQKRIVLHLKRIYQESKDLFSA